ncbi:response regulator transcription factor [Vibrio sp.]|uniref:response regulator transcription factor n=1 Tax=Vibrio sp. TaxID=678 RepID=UPI003D0A832C
MLAEQTVPAANILLVEDDEDLAALIQMHLKFQEHTVTRVTNLQDAQQQYQAGHFSMLVLDRGLPDGDGLELCRGLRARQDWTPVLILTARDSELDKVDGLEAGVDDYITKPFSVLEFQARVRNILRRVSQQQVTRPATDTEMESPSLRCGQLTIWPNQHQVQIGQQSVVLTANEFTLLYFLARKPGRVYSKDELLQHVWHTDHSGYQHTVCSTVNRLRSKLQQSQHAHDYIQTVWGVGYKFQPEG